MIDNNERYCCFKKFYPSSFLAILPISNSKPTTLHAILRLLMHKIYLPSVSTCIAQLINLNGK